MQRAEHAEESPSTTTRTQGFHVPLERKTVIENVSAVNERNIVLWCSAVDAYTVKHYKYCAKEYLNSG